MASPLSHSSPNTRRAAYRFKWTTIERFLPTPTPTYTGWRRNQHMVITSHPTRIPKLMSVGKVLIPKCVGDGMCLLCLAAMSNNYLLANEIVKNCPEACSHAMYNMDTALHRAIRYSSHQIVQLMFTSVKANAKGMDSETPLITAIRSGRPEIAHMAILNGTNVDALDIMGASAAYWACVKNQNLVLRCLIEKKAKLEQEQHGMYMDWSALHGCMAAYSPDCVKTLLQNGVFFENSAYLVHPLFTIINSEERRNIALAINNGANIDPVMLYNGNTPLIEAARKRNLGMCFELLVYGANPLAKNNDKLTARMILPTMEDRDPAFRAHALYYTLRRFLRRAARLHRVEMARKRREREIGENEWLRDQLGAHMKPDTWSTPEMSDDFMLSFLNICNDPQAIY